MGCTHKQQEKSVEMYNANVNHQKCSLLEKYMHLLAVYVRGT